MSALWNIWWARTAWHGPDSLFFTPALYAPEGTSLVLHSLSPLVSLTASAIPDSVTAYNVALVATVFLNFVCAYGAGWALTRDIPASLLAGLIFGGSPCLLVRLQGHLNVLSAWGLPLLLIALLRFERRATWRSSIALAGTLAILAYTDYYYAIFGSILATMHLALSSSTPEITGQPLTLRRRRVLVALGAIAFVDLVLMAWIAAAGGASATEAGLRLSMKTTFNPRVALGILTLAAIGVWKWPRLTWVRGPNSLSPRAWRFVPLVAGVLGLFLLPLLQASVQLWRAGGYQSQRYFWRSAPPGIDPAALVLGNPVGWLTGSWTTSVYERLGIDPVENAVWVGLVPMVMLLLAIRRRRSGVLAEPGIGLTPFFWIGALFFVWSLGPYLRVAGFNTAFMLPQTLLRFVPIVANARIPGRAFAVVVLMIALIAALSLARFPPSRRRAFAAVAIAVLLIDLWPRPQPWTPIQHPAIYDTLKELPRGVLLEVPMGIRDGFGESGRLNHWMLFYQTIHGQPQMGGFVARLSPRIRAAYESDPIIRPMLDLSAGLPSEPVPNECRDSLACAVRYVVLDRSEASPELTDLVEGAFRLTPIESLDDRALFAVDGLRSCDCGE